MRTLKKNKQTLYYANQIGTTPIYQLDEDGNVKTYVDDEGNEYPLETGEYEPLYGPAYEFEANISMSGGESEEAEFGIDKSDYDAILILDKDAVDITETSRIWHESEVTYIDSNYENADGKKADYKALKPSPSLNQSKYLLGRILKQV